MTASRAAGRVLYVQYTNPGGYPPLEHGAHLLADAGFEILMLGLDNHGGSLQVKPHPRIRVALKPFQAEGWRQKLHYVRFALAAVAWTVRFKPDWIYASDPLSCPIALLLRLSGARVIYHEHDSPSPVVQPDESRFSRAVRWARTALAQRADLCVLPNGRRAEVFRETTGRAATTTVWNTPLAEEAETEASEAARPEPSGTARLRVLYHGSIVPSRLPMAVIDAIARLPEGISLSIAGYETVGHRGYVQELVNHAAALGISDRIHVAGLLPTRQALLQHCSTCSVGLALMPPESSDINSQEMVGASNKPFDYMARGLALLVSDLPDWRATYVDQGFARACKPGSTYSLEQNLRWFLDHPAETRRMGERGRDRIRRAWNYEESFAPVLAQMGVSAPAAAASADALGRPQSSAAAGARPFFSVCIPQYNRTSFLIEACRTLEAQIFRDFEVCISDDCSNDGREADLLSYLESSGLPFVYKRRDRNGRYDANLRSALALAKGRYCFLLGNDDGLKGPETLQQVHDLLIQAPQPAVVFTNFEDFATGQIVRKGRVTRLLGSGPDVAASVFRRFSFVSGLVLETVRVEAEATSKWDGSEMYQMYLGCRMIASGGFALEADLVTVRKDIQVAGELVDSYARKPAPVVSGIPAQPIPLVQHARLVADAIGPYATGGRTRVFVSVALQFLGFLYPYWLLEYRRVRSWRFAAGVARAMRPDHTLADIRLSWIARGLSVVLYGVATVIGLITPIGVLTVLHAPARRVARLVGEWSA
jgi:glycosyltransferase involved in cell wall biosynthesis